MAPDLNISERRSLLLHSRIADRMTDKELAESTPAIEETIKRLRRQVQGEPHRGNLDRWEELVRSGDLEGLRQVMISRDRQSIEMREVSPIRGMISPDELGELLRANLE
jgi:hypothetical protein